MWRKFFQDHDWILMFGPLITDSVIPDGLAGVRL